MFAFGKVGDVVKVSLKMGQVNSTEFAEFAESAEIYNYLSSSMKYPKNYLSAYPDTLSRILLPFSIYCLLCVVLIYYLLIFWYIVQ